MIKTVQYLRQKFKNAVQTIIPHKQHAVGMASSFISWLANSV
jgi:hypothetical protein